MPRTCTICTQAKREEIDQVLLAGEPYRHIASRFGTSTAALQRHKAEHVPVHVAKAREAAEVASADDLLEQIKGLRNRAIGILNKAEKAGDYRTALMGIREARACIETLLEVEGELDRRGVVNVTVSADWVEIRTVILAALQPYPEAAQAVAERLQRIQRGAGDAGD